MTERITRPIYGHMEIEHTIDDPKTFSKPWTFTTQPTLLKGELIEYICQENNKDVEHLVGNRCGATVARCSRAVHVDSAGHERTTATTRSHKSSTLENVRSPRLENAYRVL